MRIHTIVRLSLCVCVSLLLAVASFAQSGSSSKPKKHAIPMPSGLFDTMQARKNFVHPAVKMSDAIGRPVKPAMMAAAMQQPAFQTVSLFQGSFTSGGVTYPYVMVGADPQRGGTVHVGTRILPIIVEFPDIVDSNGNPFVFDPTDIVGPTTQSPLWDKVNFGVDVTQFTDAIQRAEFFKEHGGDGTHTILRDPRVLNSIVVLVPGDDGNVYVNTQTGAFLAAVDDEFWESQLETILQLADFKLDGFAMLLTRNMSLAPNGDITQGLVGGFHDALIYTDANGNPTGAQTFEWSSWNDLDLFGDTFADTLPMSHETAEWMNDPFGTNPTPLWQIPGFPPGTCQGNLEVGDPLAGVPFPVILNGFEYHVQDVALLQWFEQKPTSNAYEHAFSFPDTAVLNGPAMACVPSTSSTSSTGSK